MTIFSKSKADVLSNQYEIRSRIFLPTYTTTERDALSNPVATNGELIYNTTTNKVEAFENGSWVDV